MLIGFDLRPEDAERFDQVRRETMANPRSQAMPTARLTRAERYAPGYVNRSDSEMSTTLIQTPQPQQAAEAAPARLPGHTTERRARFLSAVKAAFAEGDVVSASAAATAAGVATIIAADFIQQLKARGDWPFLPATKGRPSGRRGRPVIPDFDLPAPKAPAEAPRSVVRPARVEPASAPEAPPPPAALPDVQADPTSTPQEPAAPGRVDAECLAVAERLGFCVGTAIVHLWRSGGPGGLEDVKAARWYLEREIARLETEARPA